MKNIMIVTGEASGDLHGANLVKAMHTLASDLRFCGMGGPELQSQGVEILFDAEKVSVVGVFEVFSHLKDIFSGQKILKSRLAADPPDLLIIIDLPDFNLIIAKAAKKLGIPVFYYICPQVWAWRKGRVKTIKQRTDALGVILPFEESFLRGHGLHAKYVGHPLLDSVKTTLNKHEFRNKHNIDPTAKCVGLLPGSRKKEVFSLLPVFLQAAVKLQFQSNEKLVFLIPRASTISTSDLHQAGVDSFKDKLDIRIIADDRYNMMNGCDCVVAASGTVTLELAILQIPMVVTYKLSSLSYILGRLLVKLEFFSLVNLIAGYQAVPELLQDEVTDERICLELSSLLNVFTRRREMEKGLIEVKRKLGTSGASQKAAKMALELLQDSQKI